MSTSSLGKNIMSKTNQNNNTDTSLESDKNNTLNNTTASSSSQRKQSSTTTSGQQPSTTILSKNTNINSSADNLKQQHTHTKSKRKISSHHNNSSISGSIISNNIIQTNEKGGIAITEEEIESAFQFFSKRKLPSVKDHMLMMTSLNAESDKKTKEDKQQEDENIVITASNIKEKLAAFNTNISLKDARLLISGSNDTKSSNTSNTHKKQHASSSSSSTNKTSNTTSASNGDSNVTSSSSQQQQQPVVGLTQAFVKDLLLNNEIKNYDPFAEAFQIFDPKNTGFIDETVLREIFCNLGYGKINDEELKLLVQCADKDRDGKISIEDFRNMI